MKFSIGCALSLAGAAGCNNAWQQVNSQQTTPVAPVYGTAVSDTQVAPISGGTLTVLADGHTAVAADSDRDSVWIVDLGSQSVTGTVALQAGDEPGRVVETTPGTVFVSLRRAGAVAKIDTSGSGAIVGRYPVCPAPRGLAYDGTLVHVACTDGNLVSLDAGSGAVARWLKLDDDLRDVVVAPSGGLMLTTFRSATLLQVDPTGVVTQRTTLPSQGFGFGPETAPTPQPPSGSIPAFPNNAPLVVAEVAYRMISVGGTTYITHQNARNDVINVDSSGSPNTTGSSGGGFPNDPTTVSSSGYGGGSGCDGSSAIVTSGLAALTGTTDAQGTGIQDTFVPQAVLPVDIAVSSDGTRKVVVAPGNASLPGVSQFVDATDQCGNFGVSNEPSSQPNGQVIAAAFDGQDRLVAQTREPPAIYIVDTHAVIPLPGNHVADMGHEIFYSNTGGSIACASCHPEGGDDGHVWNFSDVGVRRTQDLRGVQIGDGPFHWGGELQHFSDVVSVVFEQRMLGPSLSAPQSAALQHFIHGIAPPVAPMVADSSAVSRGQALFHDPAVACSTCHSGARFTNDSLVNVGTGNTFKVPSLVGVGSRTPLMHDGCAATLADRFGACGGGDSHGHTSQLTAAQVSDLVAYLQTI